MITVYADYVCPYCLLVGDLLQKAIGHRSIRVDWRGFELRPYPVPTLRPEDPYLPKVWKESVYPLARRLGVRIKLPSWSPQPRTAKAFELLFFAKQHDVGHAYSMGVMRAFFQEDQDIANVNVIVDVAARVGLDPAEARRVLDESLFTDPHRRAMEHARHELPIKSVPTLVIGHQIFRGTPSPGALADAIAKVESP